MGRSVGKGNNFVRKLIKDTGANYTSSLSKIRSKDTGCSLLLFLSGCTSLYLSGSNSSARWLVVFGNGESLSVSGESEEGTAALSANVAIWVLSHVGGWWTVGALLLELLDLA
mgnify:CR=1 FL=1